MRFRHPLVRSAVYRAAAAPERRDVHRALAGAIDPQLDPDRRAWHRAHAAEGPDEAVADELERSAGRAQARGGLAAAAAFLERATALTPDPTRRGVRALTAAEAMLRAGAFEEALILLTTAEEAPRLDERSRARIELLRPKSRSLPAPLPATAARRCRCCSPQRAGSSRSTMHSRARRIWRRSRPRRSPIGRRGRVSREAARRLPPAPTRSRVVDLLLDSMTALYTDGYAAAKPIRQRAVRAFRSDGFTVEEGLRWLWLASLEAAELWDDEGWSVLSARHVEMARAAGAFSVLPLTLQTQAVVHVFAGELDVAASLVAELDAVEQATGTTLAPYAALTLAAWRGREQELVDLLDTKLGGVVARGESAGVHIAQWARAVLANGLGDTTRRCAPREKRPSTPTSQFWCTGTAASSSRRPSGAT